VPDDGQAARLRFPVLLVAETRGGSMIKVLTRARIGAMALMPVLAACPEEPVGPTEQVQFKVTVRAAGDGSGAVSVVTPDAPAFNWECTVVDGEPSGACSRTYSLSQNTDVVFSAQGTNSRFLGWEDGSCTGTGTQCRVRSANHFDITATANFEAIPPVVPTVAVVELTVDGGSGPVTLLQGLTANAVAVAKDANGQVLSGTTFTWSSNAPAVASVSGSSTGTATVRGESPGTAGITVAAGGVTSNAVEVTVVGPQSAKGVLQGVLYDVDGVTPLDSVHISGGPVAGSQGDALRWRTGRQIPLSDIVIPPGGYRFEATNGRYAVFSVAVLGNRYVSTPGDTADVHAGQTTTMDMNIARGYHLDMLDTDLGTIQSNAGASVVLKVDYRAWSRDMCPGCVPAIGIGVDATALAVYRFGVPGVYPGKTEAEVPIVITAPDQGGTIYATLITVSTGSGIGPGLQQYRYRWAANVQGTTMIPIGTLTVN
jgi:hypothetical protein